MCARACAPVRCPPVGADRRPNTVPQPQRTDGRGRSRNGPDRATLRCTELPLVTVAQIWVNLHHCFRPLRSPATAFIWASERTGCAAPPRSAFRRSWGIPDSVSSHSPGRTSVLWARRFRHLYMYDRTHCELGSGSGRAGATRLTEVCAITSGQWVVDSVVAVDEPRQARRAKLSMQHAACSAIDGPKQARRQPLACVCTRAPRRARRKQSVVS